MRPSRDLSAKAFNNQRLYFRFISDGIDVTYTYSDIYAISHIYVTSNQQGDIEFLKLNSEL